MPFDEIKTTMVKVSHHHAAHVAHHWPYAAYGSNLALRQMAERCRRPEAMTAGTLVGYRLAFAKWATIMVDKASTVPVGLYKLTPDDVAALDRKEGLGRSYERVLVTVMADDGRAIRCFTYLKKDEAAQAPPEKYFSTIAEGYRDWHFDDRRLRHARKRAQEEQTAETLSRRAAHSFVNDLWRMPKPKPAKAQGDDSRMVEYPSLVSGRMLKVPKFATAEVRNIEWGVRNNEWFWRVKGTRAWYRDLTMEADANVGLVRGEIVVPDGKSQAFKPSDGPEPV